MEPKHLHNNDPWMLGEDIPNADLFFSSIWLNGFVDSFDKNTGKSYSKIICKYEGYHLWFYFGEKDSLEVGEYLAKKMLNSPDYMKIVNENILAQADILRKFSETIPQVELDKLSSEELWYVYKTHQKVHCEYYSWCWIPVAVDMFHNSLTKRVKEYLREKGVEDGKLNEYFVTLTQPTEKSLIFVEQEELLRIAAEIQKDEQASQLLRNKEVSEIILKLPTPLLHLIESHRQKYYYTKHLWVSGEYTLEDYLQQLKDIFLQTDSAEKILERQYEELDKAKQKQIALLSTLRIDGKWREIFSEFGRFMVTKIYRRYAQLLAVHHMSAILKEIARRSFITEKQVRFMRPHEVENLLLRKECDEQEVLERTKLCVYYAEKGYEKIYIKDEALEILKTMEKEIDINVSELRGETGCIGYAKGPVKIIIRAEEMSKMNPGDILVSIATDPDIVPAMKKAAGIITEQGGVTSHAAIVSRELGIPCIIGTKIATKVLKDGDVVELDAGNGIVRILN